MKAVVDPKKKKALVWTERSLLALTVEGRHDFTDPQERGLVLRVTPTGSKTWAMVYRRRSDGKKARVTVGKFGSKQDQIGLKDARERAITLRAAILAGKDPAFEKTALRQADTVGELLDRYLEEHPRPNAAWTKECARIFGKDVKPAIGAVKLPELKRQHVKAVLKRLTDRGATATTNRTLAALRRALQWGVQEELLDLNPAFGVVTQIEEKPKDRALSIPEIKSFWKALDSQVLGPKSRLALKLVLLTGQRPGEVCGAQKEELDLRDGKWTIPASRTKNGKTHIVPLTPLATQVFKEACAIDKSSPYVFPSKPRASVNFERAQPMESHALSHAMRDGLRAMGLDKKPATPHDLRRTCASQMARLGFTDHVVGKILNHGTEQRRTITGRVYIVHDFYKEKQAALAVWAAELQRIIGSAKYKKGS